MTKTTSLSIVRALLTFLGTFAIGHAFAGHQVTDELWTLIGGSVVAIATTVWAVADKTTSAEGVQSLIRAAWVSAAGVLTAFGWVDQKTVDSISGLILAVLPVIQSHQARQSALFVASGAASVDSTGKIVSPPPAAKTSPSLNKVVPILAILLCLGTMASAQSLTNSLVSQLPDSAKTWKGFRVQGPIAVYAYNKQQGSSALAGLGLAYTWQSLNSDSTGWTVNEAVGIAAYAGGTQAPSSLSMVAAVGPYVSFFDGFLTVGAAYNFPTQKFLAVIGVAIPLFK